MFSEISTVHAVAGAGFIAGIAFGATAQRTNFCTMGAMSDLVHMGDKNRLRAWLLAIAVAMAGTQAMHLMGLIDVGEAIYSSPNFGWLGAILGGLMFGFGMTLTGGCGNKTLVRLGGGNLKSLVVLIILAISAYTTLRGLIGMARVRMEQATTLDLSQFGMENQSFAALLGLWTGAEEATSRGLIAAAAVLALLVYCFKDGAFRASRDDVAGGLIVGLLIPLGWAITGILGADDFEPTPLFSFTFVSPSGDSLQYLMTFSGATINFGIATIGGVIVGSFAMARARGAFHVETFTDRADMVRHLIGAVLMGVGGVLALGCTIGQGITGLSTLAMGSALALLSIMAGAVLGLKYLEEESFTEAVKRLLQR